MSSSLLEPQNYKALTIFVQSWGYSSNPCCPSDFCCALKTKAATRTDSHEIFTALRPSSLMPQLLANIHNPAE
jgi:hypothetical protein